MKRKNGKVLEVERGTPGIPRMFHLDVHRACDRFLAKRGLVTGASFRKSAWLYGRKEAA
jgi:hypothetical protein